MAGGTPTNFASGAASSHNYPALHPQTTFNIPLSSNSSHGEPGIAADPTSGGSGQQQSGLTNVGRLIDGPTSYQGTFRVSLLDDPEQYDTPYIPPRAEPSTYPALDPRRVGNVYSDHRYIYESSTSPPDPYNSDNWSGASTGPSQPLISEYVTSHTPQPSRVTSYPQYLHHESRLRHVGYGDQTSNTGGSHYRIPSQDTSMSNFLLPGVYESSAHGTTTSHYSSSSIPSSSSSSTYANPTSGVSTFSVSQPPATDAPPLFEDAGPYLRQQLGLTADASVSLRSLPDPAPGEKPSTPLPMLIKLAIYGSPNKQLTLQEIYTELENRFRWFRDHRHERAWKNSIRHNLSLNKVFRNVPRPITEPGKGSYWQLDVSGGEGYKRTRKRRPKNKVVVSEEEEEPVSEMDEDGPSPLNSSQQAGPSRSSATPVEDVQIDPELRSEGHVVGEGRTRSTSRRIGGSPYPQQSPRYQQGPLPVVSGQDASVPGQSSHRFGQSSFNFPAYSQSRSMPVIPSMSSFTDVSSATMTMGSITSTDSRPQLQHAASYDRNANVLQSNPQSGLEHVEPQGQSQTDGNAEPSSPGSSSSESPRTWKATRSRS